MTEANAAKTYNSVVMQGAGVVVLTIAFLPYWILVEQPGQLWVRATFAFFLLAMVVSEFVIGWWTGLGLLSMMRGRDAILQANVDLYLNLMAMIDLVLISLLISVTGGIFDSSFGTFLLLVPVLSMILGATWSRCIVITATLCVLTLLFLQWPRMTAVVTQLLGSYSWLMDFKAISVGTAFRMSYAWTLTISLWATYLQLTISRRPESAAVEPQRDGALRAPSPRSIQ
jgi:hypothetical protein